jgi:hypothetical protein
MTTHPIYDQLIADLQKELPEIELRVLQALREHPEGLTRHQLIAIVYGVSVPANLPLQNYRPDRKIRKAIEWLRERDVPIVSSSGHAGYRLDESIEALDSMISEWESRIENLRRRVVDAQAIRSRAITQGAAQ